MSSSQSQQQAPIKWDLLHPDIHQICEIEYLTRTGNSKAHPWDWQRDPDIIGYATALLRRFALNAIRIIPSRSEEKRIDAFAVWILQFNDKPYLPWHKPWYPHVFQEPKLITWTKDERETVSHNSPQQIVEEKLGITVADDPEEYKRDFAYLGHIQVPIHKLAETVLGKEVARDMNNMLSSAWSLSQLSIRPGTAVNSEKIVSTVQNHFTYLDTSHEYAYHLAAPNDILWLHSVGFHRLCRVDLKVDSSVVSSDELMIRRPVSKALFQEAARDEFMFGVARKIQTFALEFEGEKPKADLRFRRLEWESSWLQRDIGQAGWGEHDALIPLG